MSRLTDTGDRGPEPKRALHPPLLRELGRATLSAALWLGPLLVWAGNPSSAFEAANRLYEEGKYREAASAYQMLASGREVSPSVLFNLGNAWFKAGQIGQAIVAYRQAARLTPRDPDVRANLQFARNQVQGPKMVPAFWETWLARLTLNEWALLASLAIWLFFLLLIVRQWRPAFRPTLRSGILAAAAGAIVGCACLVAALNQTLTTTTAIVVASEAAAHHGPLDESPNAFTARDGAELRVLDQKGDWLFVTDGRKYTGWLRREQVALL